VYLDPLVEPVAVIVIGIRRAVQLDPIEEFLTEVKHAQLRVWLTVGLMTQFAQQIEQGVFGCSLVFSAFGELRADTARVGTPPATVEERLRTARHGRFLHEETLRRKREQRGGL
jgi:hypothetical protein